MKKVSYLVAMLLMVCFLLPGCSPKKAESSKEAIETAKSMKTPEQQANYLNKQAQAFFKSKEYNEAIKIAQHVLSQVDKESENAKKIIEDSKKQLQAKVKNAVDDASKKLKNLVK